MRRRSSRVEGVRENDEWEKEGEEEKQKKKKGEFMRGTAFTSHFIIYISAEL